MSFEDCFAYKGRYCSILTEKICESRKCPFHKTREQFLEGIKKYPIIDYKKYLETGQRVQIGK